MSAILLSCPFCLGRSMIYEHWNEAGHKNYHVKCLHCGVVTDNWAERDHVVQLWNTRHVVCKTTQEELKEALEWRKENGNSWGHVITEPLKYEEQTDPKEKQRERREFVKAYVLAIINGYHANGCVGSSEDVNFIHITEDGARRFDLLDNQLTELEEKESEGDGK